MATQKDIALNIKVKFEGANTVQELEDVLNDINKELDEVEQGSDAFKILTTTADKATNEIDQLNRKIVDLNGNAKTVKTGIDGLKGSTEIYSNANRQLSDGLGKAGKGLDTFKNSAGLANNTAIEFGRTLSDAPYGIRGVANNIQQLGSNFFQLRNQTGSTTLALKGLLAAFKGPLGILVLFQGAIALLDFFFGAQKKVNEEVDEAAKLEDAHAAALDASRKKRDLLNESLKESEKRISNINDLNRVEIEQMIAESRSKLAYETSLLASAEQMLSDAQYENIKMRGGNAQAVEESAFELAKLQNSIKAEENFINAATKALQGNTKARKDNTKEKIKGMTADEEFSKAISDLQDYYADRKLIISQNFIDGLISEREYDSQLSQLEDEHRQAELIALDDYGKDKTQKEQEIADKVIAIKKDENAKIAELKTKEKEEYERLTQERLQLAQGLYQDLKALSQTFFDDTEEGQKKAFEFNKMVAIAETLVSTYLAAQKAYASQMSLATPDAPFRAAVAAGLAVASGLARVATIQRTQFNSTSSSGGDGGGDNTPSNSTLQRQQSTTPNVPIIETGGEGQKIKVYVTETDIRNTTKKMTSIYSKAIVTE